MNIFNNLRIYAGRWEVTNERPFNQEEINAIVQAVVIASQYGNSVQFTMKDGGLTFIPLDQNSALGTGELVDLTKAKLVTLSRPGENDIYRVSI